MQNNLFLHKYYAVFFQGLLKGNYNHISNSDRKKSQNSYTRHCSFLEVQVPEQLLTGTNSSTALWDWPEKNTE